MDEIVANVSASSATKLRTALADTEEASSEYAELENEAEDEIDKLDDLLQDMVVYSRYKMLSFFAFIVTPKGELLEMFGTERSDGSVRLFHAYSMKRAIR